MHCHNPSVSKRGRQGGPQYRSGILLDTRRSSKRRVVEAAFLMSTFFAILHSSGKVSSLVYPTVYKRIGSVTRRTTAITKTPFISFIGSCDISSSLPPASNTRCFASGSNNNNEKKKKKKQKPVSKKFKVNENIGPEHAEKLARVFDEMARKEGFDSSMAHFADHDTFEDDFDDDFDDDDDDVVDDFEFADFEFADNDNDADMDARIAAAQRDMSKGQISVPEELDDFARDISKDDMRRLGFKEELNPFGEHDETPRREQFKLIMDPMQCSACGVDFQCNDEKKPGYLPPAKYEIQQKLAKIEKAQKQKEAAEEKEWSTDDEIEWLLRTSGNNNADINMDDDDIDIDAMAQEMGINLEEHANKKIICKRCHGLQNFGKVDESLRPGWTEEPSLSQERFIDLLKPIREKPQVIIALVDLFDFSGSVLPQLDAIAGDNPVILAANKADLLPSKMGSNRAENWVRRELEYIGIQSLANVGGAVRLISCKTGAGVAAMLAKARSLAEEMDCDIYVVGAANAGKSTLINYILDKDKGVNRVKLRPGAANSRKGALTTSPLPGTTLKFIKIDLGQGRSLFDTPGLLVPGTLTQLLTPEELKIVVPKKQVEPITFRVASGKCVLVGGLARIQVVGDCKPFLFTFFVANGIKLHPTDISKADEVVAKHVGGMLTPPLGQDRLEQMGELETHTINIEGAGWKEAAADITLTGLGWVAVTGAGTARVQICVPKGIGVTVRPPLMPFDALEVAAKYTGGRAIRKSSKSVTGKRRKGVGRR